ncbi:AtpZ/AtpI family protein [Thalassoroseus pseudoceratinae]|uniref:AtpZ/AtpI family protein n=1 Tax=Thalassoroseus pseudoceratinae TaxID=2713176 RepID=UPI00141F8132|nr:AtpZ/AtpI family protein [Thalassoroseus pseudoceratinae]
MPNDRKPATSPLAAGMAWVARITTVVAEMVIPGLFGRWLDSTWGTQYCVVIGFIFGLVIGIWHLLRMTSSFNPPASQPPDSGKQDES